jgi:hypothetical protein
VSLVAFLDAATTLLFEEFQRVGLGAFEAFDRVREWAAGTVGGLGLLDGAPAEQPEQPVERVPSAAENQRSMQEFMSRLAGVGGMPG